MVGEIFRPIGPIFVLTIRQQVSCRLEGAKCSYELTTVTNNSAGFRRLDERLCLLKNAFSLRSCSR